MGFLTLAIESSCDDTAVAVIDGQRNVLSSTMSSQVESHAPFGGVVPEYASRMHLEAILPLVDRALAEADAKPSDLDLIAVTAGPGLMGSLLVGVMTAKGLAQAWGKPILGVNHLEGHVFANVVNHPDLDPPFIAMIVSGGHTEVVLVEDLGFYRILGGTKDDAAGEAYDKVAKLLGLAYPGGPIVDELAKDGDPQAFDFPVPLKRSDEISFSFSGLKTAVLWQVERIKKEGASLPVEDICASFQRAAVEALICKLDLAVQKTGVEKVVLSGGVAANSCLRDLVLNRGDWKGYVPDMFYCTDNAVMIGAAGYHGWMRGRRSGLDLAPSPSWSIMDGV
ncbi:metalloendopeptidase, glycoprotease family [Dethiosulfovibrio peptidovorans DSM 11002]|uniref:tRNA N6-adenosine threonylcarbamoyltransferase n=1 Tax=Dethiosulfovibrio peptidovorans DSM 11002 TaxID=469381 RepID=D2Z8W9_9BACT|nr:tRNA (adenosine(37)-N6)-threonylcarbamoyltransferase complex transferase subunit TsaD [Dethiosulfovibrio peptidovorans]EFC91916.1 metalloendopeptidase, glycoprotease family [Dethiosulfovibrio peptidovorans DSM 11002]